MMSRLQRRYRLTALTRSRAEFYTHTDVLRAQSDAFLANRTRLITLQGTIRTWIMESVTKIGISGTNGQLGSSVVADLVRRAGEHEIVAITREPEKVAAPVESRLGDYDKPETLARAYAGLDRLLLIPSANLRPDVRSAQALATVDAAVATGVGHILLLSATGTRNKAEPAMGAAYWAGEHRLVTSQAKAWTILRANYLSETLAEQAEMAAGTGHFPGFAENRVAFVSRDNVANGPTTA